MLALSPPKASRVDLSKPVQNRDTIDEVMKKDGVAFGNPIVGSETTTINKNGPGDIAAKGLPSPPQMTPAQRETPKRRLRRQELGIPPRGAGRPTETPIDPRNPHRPTSNTLETWVAMHYVFDDSYNENLGFCFW